jgi:error-prone DNA polymerase
MVTSTEADQTERYAELLGKTNHSFLRGASRPEELVARAAELELSAIAVTDVNGVYGMPKAWKQAQESRIPLVVGAQLTLQGPDGAEYPPLTLLARDRAAYGVLCRLITAAHAGKPKGMAQLAWAELIEHLGRPGARGLVAIPEAGGAPRARAARLGELRELFGDAGGGPGRIFLPLRRMLDGRDAARTERMRALSARYGIPIVATNDVHYHVPERRRLQDVMTAIREGVTLNAAGRRLFSNCERHLKSHAEMRRLFQDMPEAIARTADIARSCTFRPSELRYRYPSEWIPAGETAQSHLEKLVRQGAAERYPGGVPAESARQIRHELELIDQLGFADYFLTIWEIVDFARGRGILCQGRGSAANSIVCYCLKITAIDPVRMSMLFERFISAERGEPPDIDVDFEHERREEVIQHVYAKYGRDRAAMVAAVITYRSRLAAREVRKALELPERERGASRGHPHEKEPTPEERARLPRAERLALELADELHGFPRHLSIHSGGFTLSADPIIETVPVEPARMEGRTIVQWDKDDLDAIGLLKVDLLSLGMLTCVRKSLDCVNAGRARAAARAGEAPPAPLTFTTIPPDDPATYAMIQKADTVGTFQIESRAQMSMLPRLLPACYYDLVVQVAIVRPGPIVGGMVHPYLERRRRPELIDYPHEKLQPILKRTHGVPIFQEQVMAMAIKLAGFTPGEADELRRAIGAWRSSGSIEKMGQRLRKGLLEAGLTREYVDRVFAQIQGFAEYGFPESHAASFALIAYGSAWLKCHYPAEFACALINSQPMGFYSAHTIVDDAKRHGVRVLPVHPNLSGWDCEVVDVPASAERAIRLGWRVAYGLGEEAARAIVAARAARPFASLHDFLSRAARGVRPPTLHQLALGDAFACFGLTGREALWEILNRTHGSAADAQGQLQLFPGLGPAPDAAAARFAVPDELARIQSHYAAFGLSTRGHPLQALRLRIPGLPRATTRSARALRRGQHAKLAGLVIARQSPPTARGTTFATLEDEHGFLDLILHADRFERHRELFLRHAFLTVSGRIQRDGEAVSMLVARIEPVERAPHEPDVAAAGVSRDAGPQLTHVDAVNFR